MSKLGFYIDVESCIGCRVCQIACKDKNGLDVGVNYRRVRSFETGSFPNGGKFHYSYGCNHCENPKCVEGCPTGAMHMGEDLTVQHDDDLCIGCKKCMENCPYQIPQYLEEKGITGKCNTCIDLREEGQNPACVDACLMRCLKFGPLDELENEYGPDLVQELPFMPQASLTGPSVRIHPRACALEKDYSEKNM